MEIYIQYFNGNYSSYTDVNSLTIENLGNGVTIYEWEDSDNLSHVCRVPEDGTLKITATMKTARFKVTASK